MHHVQDISVIASKPLHHSICIISSASGVGRRRRLRGSSNQWKQPPNLKLLTSRIVHLTRRRQLHQIVEEVEIAKRRYGKLNTIVMNAVLEACVHCGDIELATKIFDEMARSESCGVDSVTYGILLKGLGKARRVDEAFQILESVEQGTAKGSPKLSAPIICGLLNALIDAGDLRRANGLLARYRPLLCEDGSPSISIYNMLMKGYISKGFPQAAINLHNEVQHLGLELDRLTYNTLIHACVKNQDLDAAMQYLEEMKDEAWLHNNKDLYPDIITYTTIVKGLGHAKDLLSLQRVVLEMKLRSDLYIDRTAYTVIVDAMLNCGSIHGALCIFGEILKRSPFPDLKPKPHLYLSLMRFFSARGDYNMVKTLHRRMWPDSSGTISPTDHEESYHLLMEAACNAGQLDIALEILSAVIKRWKGLKWISRGGMAAVRIEAMLGFDQSIFNPYLLPQVVPGEPIESMMIPFEATRPLLGTLQLKKVVMRFFKELVIPIIDDWGSCVGLLHREDCDELDPPLTTMMRSPPPCVTISTSISHVIDLLLEKKYKMVIVVKHSSFSGTDYSSMAVGAFTSEQLRKLVKNVVDSPR